MDFKINNLCFSVKSDNQKFLSYLRFRLKHYLTQDSDNKIGFDIKFSKPVINLSSYDKVSSVLYKKKNNFVFKYSNLLIHYEIGNKIVVNAFFFPSAKKHLLRILTKGKGNTYNDYFEFFIVRKVIQNTFFSVLENQGFSVLHAATVKNKKNSTLFFGLGGIGKTTLALDLVYSNKLKLQGDNFVIVDKNNVYSYLEPTRITKYTFSKIKKYNPHFSNKLKTFGKDNFYIDDKLIFNGKSKIKNIIFPVLSNKLSLNKITSEDAKSRIYETMKSLNETPEFTEINSVFKKKKVNLSDKINYYVLRYNKLDDAKKILKDII